MNSDYLNQLLGMVRKNKENSPKQKRSGAQNGKAVMEFKDALETMLTAICKKDWEKFKGFLDPKLPVTAVLPPNRLIEGHDAFLQSQKDYFTNKTGKFSYEFLQLEVSSDLGVGTVKAIYQDVANGKPFKKTIFITTVMKKRQGRWVLILDQNTVLEEK